MKKYSFVIIVALSVLCVYLIYSCEKNCCENKATPNIEEKKALLVLKSGDKFKIKESVSMDARTNSKWILKENVSFGIYHEKTLLPKYIFKDSDFVVEWANNEKFLLPGSEKTSGKETVICVKYGRKQIYIIVAAGSPAEIVDGYRPATMEDFNKLFEIQ